MTVPHSADVAAFQRDESTPRVVRARASVPPDPDWTSAVCAQVDPELWFPEKGGSVLDPKRICNGYVKKNGVTVPACPLRRACLDYALSHDVNPPGIYGGTTQRERTRLRAERTTLRTRHLPTADEVLAALYGSAGTRAAS